MHLADRPATYRELTLNNIGAIIDVNTKKDSNRRRKPREFGKDITNLNLTICCENSKKKRESFVVALAELKKAQQIKKKTYFKPTISPQYLNEYHEEIYSNLISDRFLGDYNAKYMENQKDINDKMRAILIDWLVNVHLKFKCVPETLYLTVNILDRYLSLCQVVRERLQLVGVAALFIACKYEEIYPQEVEYFVYITDGAFTKKQLLDMECDILKKLDYDLNFVSPLRYMEMIWVKTGTCEIEKNKMSYLSELTLIDGNMKKFNSLEIALAAGLIACKKKDDVLAVFKDECDASKLQSCQESIFKLIKKEREKIFIKGFSHDIIAVSKKYSLEKFHSVAKKEFLK